MIIFIIVDNFQLKHNFMKASSLPVSVQVLQLILEITCMGILV